MSTLALSRSAATHLTQAARVAATSQCRQRVGAVLVKGGRVLAAATNRDHNDPAILEDAKVRMHASICAERRVIAQLPDDATVGAVIYVARVRKDGALALAKPCSRCQAVMDAAGVKRAVYTR